MKKNNKKIGIGGDIAVANLCFEQWLLDENADPLALEAAILGFKQILAKLQQPDYMLSALHDKERHIFLLEFKKYQDNLEDEDTFGYAVEA